MSLIIAGERSGVGKTTVTLSLLSFLCQRGCRVQSFKVGPDYIDPMFHRHVTGRPCRNLDPVLTLEEYVQQCFNHHTQDVTHALVEGVMGLFDGVANYPGTGSLPSGGFASTAHIARLLNLPVLLVVDCSRLSHSVAALVHGYCSFDRHLQFAGVVLNRVGSDRHLELLKSALEPLHIPILGVLRRQDSITIPDRHLGLIPTGELPDLQALIGRLAHLGEGCFDWERLLPLLERSQESGVDAETRGRGDAERVQDRKGKIRIAIAQDSAFNFYYQDNLDLLEALGAELVPWSPLADSKLPEDVHGLYLGGGFPEMFAAQLSENKLARNAVQLAVRAGMPTYAECGGLMYLCQQMVDFEERSHPMAGVLTTTAIMGKRLTLGYRQATALQDGLMLRERDQVWGHEFHRSYLTQEPETPLFKIENRNLKPTQNSKLKTQNALEGWHLPNVHASYIHLHWGARPEIPRRFVDSCHNFKHVVS